MSGNYNNKRHSTIKSTNKGCGFCRNLGKSETECHSHTVKECPLLAKTECRYCHQLGHTVKQCPMLKAKKTNSQPDIQCMPVKSVSAKSVSVKSVSAKSVSAKSVSVKSVSVTSNSFAYMTDDSEMPGEKKECHDAEQPSKPILGVWGKKSGIELLTSDKDWSLDKPTKIQPLVQEEEQEQFKDPFEDDDWGLPSTKIACWADEE